METFLSVFQFRVELGNIEANLKKVEGVKGLIPKGGLLLLPEMFCCGFDYPNMERLAQASAEVLDFLSRISKEREAVIVGTLPLKEGNRIYNTAVVFDKGRLIAKRGKIELFPLYKEPQYFSPADEGENRVIETSAGKIGIVICFEVRFNRFTNTLRREGVQIILVPAMWGIERREHFKVLTRARAVETQSFLIASNAWGKTGKTSFGGASGIYSPWGEVLAFSEDGESFLTVRADLTEVERVRKKIPVEL
jgi:predicted amidohydrolase